MEPLVNAKLPTELPDSILLTLVRSHPGKVCGEPCPKSQSLADGDRCVLTALMARPEEGTSAKRPDEHDGCPRSLDGPRRRSDGFGRTSWTDASWAGSARDQASTTLRCV